MTEYDHRGRGDGDPRELAIEQRALRLFDEGRDWLTALAQATREIVEAAPGPVARRGGVPGKQARTGGMRPASRGGPGPDATVFRRETAAAPSPGFDAAVTDALTGRGGAPLPDDVRARMAARFGVDFARVRIHTDDAADRAAQALHARAFTIGDQIYFARAAFAPGEGEGEELLVHELTHVVQAYQGRAGTAAGRVSDPGEPLEREAHAVARGAAAPQVAPTPAAPQIDGGAVFRFYPPEHVGLGAEATGNESTDIEVIFADGSKRKLTFGEMVALADCFDGVADVKNKAALNPAIEIQYALSWKLGIGSEPAGYDDRKKKVRDHVLEILATNMDHFGEEAKGAYKKDHADALAKAFEAGAGNDAKAFGDAVAREAFSQHYLSDLFAGGHIRTPRREIKEWYDSTFPASNGMFVNNMAWWMVFYFEDQKTVPWWVPDDLIVKEIEGNIFTMGGAAIATASVGDIVGAAFHNLDSNGLHVISDVDENGNVVPGGYRWEAKGDDNLGATAADSKAKGAETTRRMAVAAMRASRKELDDARAAGLAATGGKYLAPAALLKARDAAIKGMQPYRAEKFIPREDVGNAANPQYEWHWGKLDAKLAAEVSRLVKTQLINMLREKAAGQPEVKVVDKDTAVGHLHMDLPLRASMLYYCQHLDDDPLSALMQILGGKPANAAAPPKEAPPPPGKVGAWDDEG